MTGMLPVVEQLLDCETDAERARWLLTVPLYVLYRDQVAIRKALRAARFALGEILLDAEIAGLTAVRSSDGKPGDALRVHISMARYDVRLLVRIGGA